MRLLLKILGESTGVWVVFSEPTTDAADTETNRVAALTALTKLAAAKLGEAVAPAMVLDEDGNVFDEIALLPEGGTVCFRPSSFRGELPVVVYESVVLFVVL